VPAAIVAVGGVTVRPVSVPDPTVRTAVPLTVPLVAVMLTVPAATGCARPVETPTVAFVVSEDDHVTKVVMSRVVLSEKPPIAANCTAAPPTLVTPGLGVTEMEASVAVDTVSVADPDFPPNIAVIVLDPDAMLVARPRAVIVAVDGFDDCQDAEDVTSCVVPSEYCAVAANCSVVPTGRLAEGGVTVMPVSVPAPTMRTAFPVTVPRAAVMVTVPAATGCASPDAESMVAFVPSEDDQVTKPVMSPVVPSENVPIAEN
jgi:hypothetical protein